ncbi:alpha-amylase family glycosyl hydrolase [Protaetiibacter mangrovi]|uniref:alpha-amylase family glycosyl hydrolase n=1 Tax=Protaetiibacter mangrovi TaxID=2970926 RepID=UPI0027E52A67|nr:alpha-amylase family glycosyl hydrolase [Protaetiibacter mangrovi]
MRRRLPRPATLAIVGAAVLALVVGLTGLAATAAPLLPRGAYTDADAALIRDTALPAGAGQSFYFVMTDRFANGDPTNDTGGLTGDRDATGFDPADTAYYQGGDLAGLLDRLDYIEGLGVSAVWLTPSFVNKPVQGIGAGRSAGYHGYWVTDFTRIDPHLGTDAELDELVDALHARGMRLYFDIITNHTADVISYGSAGHGYIATAAKPYLDADGNPIDLGAVAESDDFPVLDAATSFPYVPEVDPAEADLKVPSWLNDVTKYHNRGDTTWAGESVTLGDFAGLDDLMTEDPAVLDGFVDVYSAWMDRGVDGFRIDTVKHVNSEFWQGFTSALDTHAQAIGRPDFFVFGEVYDADPAVLAPYVRDDGLDAVLDFPFQAAALDFVNGAGSQHLSQVFSDDPAYTTPSGDARALPTFLGNHDMGRVGYLVRDQDALARDELAQQLLFLARGQPVVYAGDEQGFTGVGDGTDRHARQSLFATRATEYADQTLVTGETAGAVDRYDTDAPLYALVSELANLRSSHPALATGAQLERLADGSTYAFSRVDGDEKVEHLVVLNASAKPVTVEVPTLTRGARFSPLSGTADEVGATADGVVSVTVPAMSAAVWVADREVTSPAAAVTPVFTSPAASDVDGIVHLDVDAGPLWSETSFAWRVVGTDTWHAIGTATGPDPRVVHDVRGLAGGTRLEYRAVTVDAADHRSAASVVVTVS